MDGDKKSRKAASLDRRSDRKSATGMSGDPKKGGRGGKFTWEGADGYTDEDLDLVSVSTTGRNGNGGGRSNAIIRKTRDEDGGDDQ